MNTPEKGPEQGIVPPVEVVHHSKPATPRAERLLPANFGTDHLVDQEISKANIIAESLGESLDLNREKVRKVLLNHAPSLNSVLTEEYREMMRARNEGKPPAEQEPEDPPENVNLAFKEIKAFRRVVHEAQSLRKVVRQSKDPSERLRALDEYAERKRVIDKELADYGLSFQKDYREYLASQGDYGRFMRTLSEVTRLETVLHEPSFKALPQDATLDVNDYSRLERIMHDSESQQTSTDYENIQELLDSLKTVFPEGSPEYEDAKQTLLIERPQLPPTKKELEEKVASLHKEAAELWEDPMVQYFYHSREFDELMRDFGEGKDVIETQSVIANLNKLHDWETQHQRTTIGGVLVGPPGVGKTTLVHHYLQEKDRGYVYIDLSEDVTRYMLYGSKAIDFKSAAEYYEALHQTLDGLDEGSFDRFIQENSKTVKKALNLSENEATAVLLSMIEEDLSSTTDSDTIDPELRNKLNTVRSKVTGLAESRFHHELAQEFSHLVKKNGWRDGVIISALRRGDVPVLDEFNKCRNWSLMYSLMTAKPGEPWYFADNDEWIDIPDTWRMYFTANVGKKHGVFQVAEALASRAGGKVMELDYPPIVEETRVALVSLANAEGDFLRSESDLAKLVVLVHEVFPSIRKHIEDKNQAIPISYRTIRDLGEKLVLYKDPATGKPVYQPTNKTFDAALYEVLIDTYALYEDRTLPKEIVRLATSAGLLLDESVREQVEKHIGHEEFDKLKTTFDSPEKKKDMEDVVNMIRGMITGTGEFATAIPTGRGF